MALTEGQRKYLETCTTFDDDMRLQLQDPEFQSGWLALTIQEFAQTGDYDTFYRCLEYVIKARGTVSGFAEQIGMNRANLTDLLHGKTKTSPDFTTITKILNGLGYTLSVEKLSA